MIKYILCYLLLTISCFSYESPDKNKLFINYLKNTHNLYIAHEKHCYLIIRAEGCESCKPLDFDYFQNLSKNKNITIIISYPKRMKLPSIIGTLLKEKIFLLDRGEYFKWNITPLCDGLITTENKIVRQIIELDATNSDIIDRILKENNIIINPK